MRPPPAGDRETGCQILAAAMSGAIHECERAVATDLVLGNRWQTPPPAEVCAPAVQ